MVRSHGRRGGGGGDFEDSDGDGVSELKKDHADFQGGEARNVALVETDRASVGNRPVTSTDNKRVTVGPDGDYSKINDALRNEVPYFPRGKITIDIANGTYNEDVVIPPFVASRSGPSTGRLLIRGNSGDRTDVSVNSVTHLGSFGGFESKINSITIAGTNPYHTGPRGVGIAVLGGRGSMFQNCKFVKNDDGGPRIGMVAHNAAAELRNPMFGGQYTAVKAERDAVITLRRGSGTVNSRLCRLSDWSVVHVDDPTDILCAGYYTLGAGDQGTIYTHSGFPVWPNARAGNDMAMVIPRAFSEHPSFDWGAYWTFPDDNPGVMWWIDGSGTPSKGLYVQKGGEAGITQVV